MKQYIITSTLLLLCSFCINAQEVNKIHIKKISAKYIKVEYQPKNLLTKSYLIIDYGQIPTNTFGKERRKLGSLMDNDEEIIFKSDIEALNFLAENGYKFIESHQDIKTNVYDEINSVSRKFILENLNYK